ncbi:Bifunctional serine threonine kinase and phosphorylase involved in the regulation of the phosphoenolpyruvate synthase (PEPS) by catalyzing its phosphorylation dephosphorylation [Vibrio sp. B1ASS3]|uniref:posphoenolpyruvate synthetase regulatory kinase/phosphorylase PpsR n=1 Tax=Vibrio sp. B1ASS3 TaxID=2751176 RepID=UPI001ABB1F6E|nr:pyruvate, water dikinase regulatory protein [Vibrio sp. B1ASS3]CAD7822364.1 Bifunctional serine threonine kinase and phosphorylase involved in the regulation of the phosphoenolpyruvate synthase (PEPS) by catalyzing its phosphorylation dephosphorylation [Vibrio sp. B1ASS3]CAE6947550.1 Bifunctional serine threonine kinase and phosphorylase involved in the regulation of the phosphoenolpyruvate synthase (PEPS) by catalyzing its phosphorylation dephosphorylation [Vibrio sp. B1ASS3]
MQINSQSRDVFYVSDGTAITCETLGHVVLGQFSFIPNEKTFPFVESEDKVADVIKEIEISYQREGIKPLVFFSIVVPEIREMLLKAPAHSYDVLESIVQKVQDDIQMEPQPKMQRSRSVSKDSDTYFDRIAAIEYTLAHDDGITLKGLDEADIILLGVSRSGKTPTSLYMAMQFGLRVVNYPFIAEDVKMMRLLPEFEIHRHKLFGLTINPERLNEIRENRLSGSEYASTEQCKLELDTVEALFRREAIPYINTSSLSVEEITTRILERAGMKRRLFG